MHTFSMLYTRFWFILICWKIGTLVTGLENNEMDRISFKLEPIKYSNYNTGYDDFCFVMELTAADEKEGELTSNVLFRFSVADVIPFQIDTERFGGTSKSRGLQSLHMSIEDPVTGNLLSSTRHLKSGITYVELNSGSSHSFKVCLTNLVYDSSWLSIDVLQYITITLNTKKQLALLKAGSLKEEYEVHEVMDDSMKRISRSINGEVFEALRLTEMEHRDLNESLYGSFVITSALMIAALSLPPIILSCFCLKYRKVPKL